MAQDGQAIGLAIVPDSNPGAGHYYRSDHFSLARVGVPAFSIGPGDLYQGHNQDWGLQKMRDFVAKDYHHPSVEYRRVGHNCFPPLAIAGCRGSTSRGAS
ncbi:MAG TPA: hypothetical protein VMU45_06275 [Candidatus Eisenbacteria bacterium]|nr:hypothetical protein [Candidatus Eisenbacteria bacterium]